MFDKVENELDELGLLDPPPDAPKQIKGATEEESGDDEEDEDDDDNASEDDDADSVEGESGEEDEDEDNEEDEQDDETLLSSIRDGVSEGIKQVGETFLNLGADHDELGEVKDEDEVVKIIDIEPEEN